MDKPTVVLVVEDEPLLLLLAGTLVEEAGLQPLYAEMPTSRRHPGGAAGSPIVFTDVNAGSMDGIKLPAAIRHRWPPIQIVVVSGTAPSRPANSPRRAILRKTL